MIKKIFQCFILVMFTLFHMVSKGNATAAPQFVIGSVSNVSATSVVIPVTAKNFQQLLAWQGSMNWDNSRITFASVSSPVAQLTGIQFNPSVTSSTGRLSFIWVDNNLTPQSIADSTVLFSLTFNVVAGATGPVDINFTSNPTQLMVSDAAGNAVPDVTYTKGAVTFPGVALAPEFYIGSATNVSTTQVSIPVTAKNFSQLLAWQGSLSWDNSKITYAGTNSMHSQLNGIQFNSSNNGTTGTLSFIWADDNLAPQTITDNAVLFSILFNVVNGAQGITDIAFGNTPTALLVSNAQNEPVAGVKYIKGSVSFPGAGLPPQFMIGSVFNAFTSTIDVPVKTTSFVDLLGWQGSINWDNSKLTFKSISTTASAMNGIQFNPSVSGNAGRLSFIWAESNVVPLTIVDSAVLFTISFNVVNSTGYSDVTFTNTPTPLMVSNSIGAAVSEVIYTKGVETFSKDLCSGGNTTVTSNISGVSYQWQVNKGDGAFINLSDDTTYAGTTSMTLELKNVPNAISGYQYRCQVNGNYSNVFTLRFRDYWSGSNSASWENPANWGCPSKLPDANTDVIINTGTVILNSNTAVKSITLSPGANLVVQPGQNLTITGKLQ